MNTHFFLLVKSNIYVIYCVLKKFRMNVSFFVLLSCECAFLVETVILTITSVIRRKMTLTHFFQLLEYYFICFSLKCPQLSSSNKKSLIKKISLTSLQQAQVMPIVIILYHSHFLYFGPQKRYKNLRQLFQTSPMNDVSILIFLDKNFIL